MEWEWVFGLVGVLVGILIGLVGIAIGHVMGVKAALKGVD